ncbi:MAG: TolC family protein [Saprospiraceae bacterium]
MNKNIKFKFLLALLIVQINNSYCQSVNYFIEQAIDNNQGLKALRLDYQAAVEKSNQVSDYPDPKVNLGLGILPVETRLGAQRLKVGLTQSIPWKGLLNAQENVMKSKAEVSASIDKVKQVDIEFVIRLSYAKLVFLRNRNAIISDKLIVLEALIEIAKSSIRSGKGKLSNVLFTERKIETLKADLELLNQQEESPIIILNRWAERDLLTPIEVDMESEQQSMLDYKIDNHPQFEIFENRKLVSDQIVNLTKFQSKPKIGVGLDYSLIDKRDNVNIENSGRDVLMPMGTITIPLNTGRFKSQQNEEMLKQQSIDASILDKRRQFEAEIAGAQSNIKYAEMIKIKYEKLKEITLETLKLMRIEYATEGTRFEELLRLNMELIDYDFEILKANYAINNAIAVLKKYID